MANDNEVDIFRTPRFYDYTEEMFMEYAEENNLTIDEQNHDKEFDAYVYNCMDMDNDAQHEWLMDNIDEVLKEYTEVEYKDMPNYLQCYLKSSSVGWIGLPATSRELFYLDDLPKQFSNYDSIKIVFDKDDKHIWVKASGHDGVDWFQLVIIDKFYFEDIFYDEFLDEYDIMYHDVANVKSHDAFSELIKFFISEEELDNVDTLVDMLLKYNEELRNEKAQN